MTIQKNRSMVIFAVVRLMVFAGTTGGRQFAGEFMRTAQNPYCMAVYTATEYGGELLREALGPEESGTADPTTERESSIEIRTGRLGAEEMYAEMLRFKPDFVVDCTHPHAQMVTKNIRAACGEAGCRYLRLRRGAAGKPITGKSLQGGVVYVDTMDAAAEFLKHHPGRILVTTGSKETDPLAQEELRDRVFLRILPLEDGLQKCRALGFKVKNLICMQGPFSEDLNRAMLRQIGASYLLTRESGDEGGFAEKLSAAALEGVTAVVIRQPTEEAGYTLEKILSILMGREQAPEQAKKFCWFPVFRNIQGKRVVIVGGGNIALRRVKTLLRFDCTIEIIAPDLHDELTVLAAANPGVIEVMRRPFADGDCRLDYLVAATGDRELNHRISRECLEKNIPVSVADCREESTFYFPAVILWDQVVLGLSSGGKDHSLVRGTADKIRNIIGEGGYYG
ncbi:hypothetical protein AGMMS4952_15330 [Spirochaetia bacterium]|nr:hypothetical protein AGMMS4952_15330 [Spirochaetia bacterium]